MKIDCKNNIASKTNTNPRVKGIDIIRKIFVLCVVNGITKRTNKHSLNCINKLFEG